MDNYKPTLLDCTLRDGSYEIDFQFDENDTFSIARNLSKCNIPYIEVGHGIGLGASKKRLGIAAASDEQYCKASSKAIEGNSKWGMFCIPGIATLDDLSMAIDYGMDFVRIGCDVDKVDDIEKFVIFAKKNGIEVFSNFMKSYVISPKEFAKIAKKSLLFGSDVIYIVDSAGGMLPSVTRDFIKSTKDFNPDCKLGFHGHDNLGLGMANCIVCIEEGVNFLDSSLQGLGRSSGNVVTEHLVCVLDKLGYNYNWDPIKIMDIAELLIRPLISKTGLSSLDITAGWAEFHSSFMEKILLRSKEERLDPRVLIKNLCELDNLNAETKTLDKIIYKQNKNNKTDYRIKKWPNYFGNEESII